MVVIHSAPGIGKTETARQIVLKNSKYFYKNLIWVYAETQDNIEIKLHTRDVSQVYSKFAHSICLIIFDNAENMAAIKGFMPMYEMNKTGKVLITSQFGDKIHIDSLNLKNTVEIINEKLGVTFYKNPQIDWYKIVERLDCIPLSVQFVTSILHEKFRTIPIGNYDFNGFINKLTDGTFINSDSLISKQNFYNKTVLSSIFSVLNRLRMKKAALDLLTLIAYLDADYIHHNDLLIFVRNGKLQEALNTLKDYSLIQFDFKECNYKISIHRTIQLVLRKYDLYTQNGKIFNATLQIILLDRDLHFLHRKMKFKLIYISVCWLEIIVIKFCKNFYQNSKIKLPNIMKY